MLPSKDKREKHAKSTLETLITSINVVHTQHSKPMMQSDQDKPPINLNQRSELVSTDKSSIQQSQKQNSNGISLLSPI